MMKQWKKTCCILLSMALVISAVLPALPVEVQAEEVTNNDSYYESRISSEMDGELLDENGDWFPAPLAQLGAPCHVTGNSIKNPKTGNTLIEIELKDGTKGYLRPEYVDQGVNAVINSYVKKDCYLLSSADKTAVTKTIVAEGTRVSLLEVKDSYSQIETPKKQKGWLPNSLLQKREPKYMYAITQGAKRYRNSGLKEHLVQGSNLANHGYVGSVNKGEKVEFITVARRKGVEPSVYAVYTADNQLLYMRAKDLSFELPRTLYARKKIKIYKSENTTGNIVKTVVQGTKMTRVFTKGKVHEVKLSDGTRGWVKASDISYTKIAKARKSYGTYYTTLHHNSADEYYIRYPIGSKVIRVDDYYYNGIHEDDYDITIYDKSKKKDKNCKYIKVQFEDGNIRYLYYEDNKEVNKNRKEALNYKKDSIHFKKVEKKLFKELNKYRKSLGLKEVKWNKMLYKLADSYFNFCTVNQHLSFPHMDSAYMWPVFGDIVSTGGAPDAQAAEVLTSLALGDFQDSSLHDQMLKRDFESVGIICMWNKRTGAFEASFLTGANGMEKWDPAYDTPFAQEWYPFIYEKPQFTNNRGEEYTGYIH